MGLLIPEIGLPVVLVAMAFLGLGLGLGLAMRGYTAGPTLTVRREEQGGLAGLIGATNGLTFVVAPILSTALYGLWPPAPMVLGVAIALVVFWFVMASPRLRPRP